MPKIAAPTVAEHREHILAALVDAAEAILRAGQPLTAGVVSQSAGIARNSIYRYVDSVDDLRGLVLKRYLPAWDDAVTSAMAPLSDPGDRIVEWVRVNLEQAHETGHGWLITMTREAPQSTKMTELADHAHRIMRDALGDAWVSLIGDRTEARIMSSLTLGLLGAAFQQLDSDLPYERIVDASVSAARSLVDSVPPQP